MSLLTDAINILKEYRDVKCKGNSSEAATNLGVAPETFWRWTNEKNIPKLQTLSPVLEVLGARIVVSGVGSSSDCEAELVRLQRLLEEHETYNAALERQITTEHEQALQLRGEVRALEKQLMRLMPTPAAQSGSADAPIAQENPQELEEEQPSCDLKTVNG